MKRITVPKMKIQRMNYILYKIKRSLKKKKKKRRKINLKQSINIMTQTKLQNLKVREFNFIEIYKVM